MTAIATPLPSPLPRRGLQGFLGAILAGIAAGGFAWLALGHGAQSIFLQGFILLVPVPLYMAGLGIGRSDAIVATLVAAAAMAIGVGADLTMLVLQVLYACPILLISLLATRYRYDASGHLFWYPTGRLLVLLVLYPVCVFGLASFLAGSGGIEGVIHNAMVNVVDALFKGNDPSGLYTPEMKKFTVNQLTALAPTLFMVSWIIVLAITGIWTQVALTSNKLALRPMPSLMDMDIPMALLVLLAIMGLMAGFFSGPVAYFARSVLVPLSLPYFFVGVGLMHLWARQRKHKHIWLVAFYIFVFFLRWPVILVATVGVLEPWFHLRTRIGARAGAGNV